MSKYVFLVLIFLSAIGTQFDFDFSIKSEVVSFFYEEALDMAEKLQGDNNHLKPSVASR